MAFQLADIVPWGRSFDEYRHMFALTEADLQLQILACADGPASFNAESRLLGHQVTSCDPIYQFSQHQIRQRIQETYDQIIDQTQRNQNEFLWTKFPSIEALGQTRMQSMNTFLNDYDSGLQENRYINASLPNLPFPNQSFNLTLCSHFLFLYSQHLDQEFHLKAIQEMCRVSQETRIFPLVALGGKPSPHVNPVKTKLIEAGFNVSIEKVDYEFQRGANQMMRIYRGPSS